LEISRRMHQTEQQALVQSEEEGMHFMMQCAKHHTTSISIPWRPHCSCRPTPVTFPVACPSPLPRTKRYPAWAYPHNHRAAWPDPPSCRGQWRVWRQRSWRSKWVCCCTCCLHAARSRQYAALKLPNTQKEWNHGGATKGKHLNRQAEEPHHFHHAVWLAVLLRLYAVL